MKTTPTTETDPTEMGPNRTGILASPIDSKKTIEGARAGIAANLISTEPTAIHGYRVRASTEVGPVGTMPPPGTLKGAAKTALKAMQGESANVLIDKMAGRTRADRRAPTSRSSATRRWPTPRCWSSAWRSWARIRRP
jgi:hypothetical protein